MASAGEIAIVVALLVAAALIVAVAARGHRAVMLGSGAILVAVSVAATAMTRGRARLLPRERPRPSATSTYVSSSACRACHPGEHASFMRTFHRTMTQDATGATVLAPMDGASLLVDGRQHRLWLRGGEVWATLPDPEAAARRAREGRAVDRDVPDVDRRVVITTGSHREQAFWVAGEREGELRLFPFVWLVRERRFVPRRDAFLTPPDASMPPVRWNSNCIACHAVAGEPRHDEGRDAFDTRAAELGIACEACHGPGAEHVARHRDPVARYVQSASKNADPTIVHPARLDPARSAALCGQCHAYAFPRDPSAWWTHGYAESFRPGDLLERSRVVLGPTSLVAAGVDAVPESLFWPDGSIRVGGREYNGLVASRCYAGGEGARKATCLSCHAMHRGDPAGQIAPDHAGDRGCTSCHGDERARNHGHHAAGSAGSACIDCHMPKTSYALFSAVRSHRIDVPSAAATLATGKPNACNLCHLDKPLAWTARMLTEWYGTPPLDLRGDRVSLAEGLVEALSGDAAVRVVVADALGSKAALGSAECRAPILAELLVDPYSAVRFVAGRSLAALPGYGGIPFDFLDSAEARDRSRIEVLDRARRAGAALDPRVAQRLLGTRDDRKITIAE